MTRNKIDLNERNRALTLDLEQGTKADDVAKKYKLSLPYIREILRRDGKDHLLDGAKPRLRTKRRNV